jgi:hypothetical protein
MSESHCCWIAVKVSLETYDSSSRYRRMKKDEAVRSESFLTIVCFELKFYSNSTIVRPTYRQNLKSKLDHNSGKARHEHVFLSAFTALMESWLWTRSVSISTNSSIIFEKVLGYFKVLLLYLNNSSLMFYN